jgi:predicted 3-demethylubiquinone-9 3-methyltransferase (glyoxalase superfamily)
MSVVRREAEEAAAFYASVFPDSHVDKVVRSAADNPSTSKGEVLTVEFTVAEATFVGLNGGPDFTFNEAVSFMVDCDDQVEVDRFWEALVEGGGEHGPCGWLKDRFGVSWQVVPRQLNQMLESPDRDAAERAMEAMLKMGKLDIRRLQEAYEGVPA